MLRKFFWSGIRKEKSLEISFEFERETYWEVAVKKSYLLLLVLIKASSFHLRILILIWVLFLLGLFLAWVGGKGMSSTQSSRDFQNGSGYFLNQTWNTGSDYGPSNPMYDCRRLESDPRKGFLNAGCSSSILAWKCHCSNSVCLTPLLVSQAIPTTLPTSTIPQPPASFTCFVWP